MLISSSEPVVRTARVASMPSPIVGLDCECSMHRRRGSARHLHRALTHRKPLLSTSAARSFRFRRYEIAPAANRTPKGGWRFGRGCCHTPYLSWPGMLCEHVRSGTRIEGIIMTVAPLFFDVTDPGFRAYLTGQSDCTAAFQAALDAAGGYHTMLQQQHLCPNVALVRPEVPKPAPLPQPPNMGAYRARAFTSADRDIIAGRPHVVEAPRSARIPAALDASKAPMWSSCRLALTGLRDRWWCRRS